MASRTSLAKLFEAPIDDPLTADEMIVSTSSDSSSLSSSPCWLSKMEGQAVQATVDSSSSLLSLIVLVSSSLRVAMVSVMLLLHPYYAKVNGTK